MESWGCIVIGMALIASSALLSRLRPPDWTKVGPVAPQSDASMERWSSFQRTIRLINNLLLALIGVLIGVTGLMAHTQTWMIVWLCVLLLLMIVVLLACLDAFTSMTGYRRAVPEAARRSFGEQENP